AKSLFWRPEGRMRPLPFVPLSIFSRAFLQNQALIPSAVINRLVDSVEGQLEIGRQFLWSPCVFANALTVDEIGAEFSRVEQEGQFGPRPGILPKVFVRLQLVHLNLPLPVFAHVIVRSASRRGP